MNFRETVVNVAIGAVLLLTFALIIAAGVAALGIVFYGVALAARHFLPPIGDDFIYLSEICLFIVINCAASVRRRLWLNAILALSIAAIPLANLHNIVDPLGSRWLLIWPLMLTLVLPTRRKLHAWESALLVGLILTGLALSTSFFGSGSASRILGESSYIGLIVWAVLQWRRRDIEQTAFTPSSST